MSLPLRQGPPDRRRVPRGGRRSYDRPGRHPAILVADSYDRARLPMVRYLDRYGFNVSDAANGEEALSRILVTTPRIVLIEWSLPMMSGQRMSQWLAQGWRTRDVRVIALVNDEPAVRLPQPDAVLIKPFSLTTMLEEIRQILRRG